MLFGTYRNPLLFPLCRLEESIDEERSTVDAQQQSWKGP